jgi:hypothetical protein
MDLYFMQHGAATSEAENPERPLTQAGQAAVQTVPTRARAAGVHVGVCVHSGKLRAEQSAQLFMAGPLSDGRDSRIGGARPGIPRADPASAPSFAQGAAGELAAGPPHAVALANLPRDSVRPSPRPHLTALSDHQPVVRRVEVSATEPGPNPATDDGTECARRLGHTVGQA